SKIDHLVTAVLNANFLDEEQVDAVLAALAKRPRYLEGNPNVYQKVKWIRAFAPKVMIKEGTLFWRSISREIKWRTISTVPKERRDYKSCATNWPDLLTTPPPMSLGWMITKQS